MDRQSGHNIETQGAHQDGVNLKEITIDEAFLDLVPMDFARRHLIIAIKPSETGHEPENICVGDLRSESSDVAHLLVARITNSATMHNVMVRLGRSTFDAKIVDSESIARFIDASYERHQPRDLLSSSSSSPNHTEMVGAGASGTALSSSHAFAAQSDAEVSIRSDSGSNASVSKWLEEADRDLLSTQGKGPVVRLVDAILFEALSHGASDVHIQPLADQTMVRYRVDGVLHDVHHMSPRLTVGVISRVKVMGRMDIAERRIPQDGRATVTIAGRPIDLRLSTVVTSYGERAVIRLLDNTRQLCEFGQLGMRTEIGETFLQQAGRSNGMILVTGPTGSGKSTTLYSTLKRIATGRENIMTIEDPIEYELATVGLAVSQIQVNSKKGMTFATGLRHVLRQDPDVIMVGEIRDAETARMAIQSSLTGHLVLSTMHTNDAPSAVTRLVDLGVEPYLVSASLTAVLAQRLVRTLHSACNGSGCAECFGTGYRGRTGIFELMLVDDVMRQLIIDRVPLAEIRAAARREGMRTLEEEGLRLVDDEHATNLVEVQRVVQTV